MTWPATPGSRSEWLSVVDRNCPKESSNRVDYIKCAIRQTPVDSSLFVLASSHSRYCKVFMLCIHCKCGSICSPVLLLSNDFLCFEWAGTATVPRSMEKVEKQIKAYFWDAQQTLRPNTINLCQFDLPTDFQWATAIANQFHNIFWNFPAHFIACYYYSCCCCCCCSCCCYCCCWCCDYWCVKIQSLCGCCCFDYSDGCCNLCFLSLFSYRVLYLEYVFCIHYNMGTCNKSYSLPWREFNWILNKIELIISLLSALLTSSVSLANELVCKVYLTCVVHKLQLSCRS